MSRSRQTTPQPSAGFAGRVHEYRDHEDGRGLVLVAVSPGCICCDCVRLRTQQNGSRR